MNSNETSHNYPNLLVRTKAVTLDTLLVVGAMLLFTVMLDGVENVPPHLRMILFLSLLLYEPVCTAFGSTIGQYELGVRIRKHADPSQRINIFQAIFRFVIKFLFGWLSYLVMLASHKNRALHDVLSGSMAVSVVARKP